MDSQFTQSQAHGLFWDSEIRQNVFDLPSCINDTEKFDVPHNKNKFNQHENISIKTSGNTNIDCGDILRFYDRDDFDTTMILLNYKQNNDYKEIGEITEINYSEEMRNILFGNIPREELEEYVNFIKSIPSGKAPKEIRDEYIKRKKDIQKKYDMKINISPKVDSKKQRRVQCSIPKTEQLLKKYPQFIISKTTEPIVRGIQITPAIKSPKRVRHSKAMD
jgi:hypothetical protein